MASSSIQEAITHLAECARNTLSLSRFPIEDPKALEANFKTLFDAIQSLRRIQTPPSWLSPSDSEEPLSKFVEWLEKEGFELSSANIKIGKAGDSEGNGVFATKPFKQDDVLLRISRSLMLPMSHAITIPALHGIALTDSLVVQTPSLLLTLVVMTERFNPQSKWGPYLDILPKSYSTPLNYSFAEISLLKECEHVYGGIVRLFINAALQYAHIRSILSKLEKDGKDFVPLKDWTWDAFIWAVSAVLTRQNEIPVNRPLEEIKKGAKKGEEKEKRSMELAMIPVWDMCNHKPGQISTYFDTYSNFLEYRSMEDIEENDQVYIAYGPRSNLDLLLYSGFVLEKNPFDRSQLWFTLPEDDPPSLRALKEKILDRVQRRRYRGLYPIDPSGTINDDGMQFLRVAMLNEEELEREKGRANFFELVSLRNEVAVNNVVCEILRKTTKRYTTTYEEDGRLIGLSKKNPNAQMAILCRMTEKKLLTDALKVQEALGSQLRKKLQNRNKKKKSQKKKGEMKKEPVG